MRYWRPSTSSVNPVPWTELPAGRIILTLRNTLDVIWACSWPLDAHNIVPANTARTDDRAICSILHGSMFAFCSYRLDGGLRTAKNTIRPRDQITGVVYAEANWRCRGNGRRPCTPAISDRRTMNCRHAPLGACRTRSRRAFKDLDAVPQF